MVIADGGVGVDKGAVVEVGCSTGQRGHTVLLAEDHPPTGSRCAVVVALHVPSHGDGLAPLVEGATHVLGAVEVGRAEGRTVVEESHTGHVHGVDTQVVARIEGGGAVVALHGEVAVEPFLEGGAVLLHHCAREHRVVVVRLNPAVAGGVLLHDGHILRAPVGRSSVVPAHLVQPHARHGAARGHVAPLGVGIEGEGVRLGLAAVGRPVGLHRNLVAGAVAHVLHVHLHLHPVVVAIMLKGRGLGHHLAVGRRRNAHRLGDDGGGILTITGDVAERAHKLVVDVDVDAVAPAVVAAVVVIAEVELSIDALVGHVILGVRTPLVVGRSGILHHRHVLGSVSRQADCEQQQQRQRPPQATRSAPLK